MDNLKAVQVFQENKDNLFAITIDNVFSIKECNEWIEFTEKQGYEAATVNLYGTQVVNKQFRDNARCIITNDEMSNKIYSRISHLIPNKFKDNELIGINERLSFLRYYVGQDFKTHKDGTVISDDGLKKSYLTIQLYLNNVEKGGETIFNVIDGDVDHVAVSPKIGTVLIFQHDILHKGSAVTAGVKYVVRGDIFYTNK